MVVKMNRPDGGAPTEKKLPSYDEAIGHKSLLPGPPKQLPEAAVTDAERRDPQIPDETNGEELRKWVMGIVTAQTQMAPPQKQALHSRAEQLKNVLIARAKLASMSNRSDTVTSEMKRQVDKASVIKRSALPSKEWDQYANDASSKIRLSSKRGVDEEEISRGIVLVGKARQVPAVALAARCNAEDAQAAVNEFKVEPKSQDESKAMFCLYEAWASATLAIRDDLFAFVASPLNQTALGPAMIARMSRTLESIDQPANLVAHRQCPNNWFVFYMALKVYSNMAGMQKLMRSFERTLLPDDNAREQCPVCLKSNCGAANFKDLDCRHGICGDCFVRLGSLPAQDGNHMCPVCRHSDFLTALSNAVGV